MNYIYYCLYRFILKTPIRADADAWPIVFLALTAWIHALTVYFLFTLFMGVAFGPKMYVKLVGITGLILSIAALGWYYVWMENGARVIREYEKRGSFAKYARIGAILWYEALILPFLFAGLLIISQKLTGWPPPP